MCTYNRSSVHFGLQVAPVERRAETRLGAAKRGRSLEERRRVAEGVQPSMLSEKLLVRHRVDGRREGEGRAAKTQGDKDTRRHP